MITDGVAAERQNAMATRERQHASFRALLLDTYPREPRERSWCVRAAHGMPMVQLPLTHIPHRAVVRKKLTGRTAFKVASPRSDHDCRR